MAEKKVEYDRLKALHIYQLWEADLDKFLVELDKYEAQEEKDRLAFKGAKNQTGKGKIGGKKKAAGAQKGASAAAIGKAKNNKPSNLNGGSGDKKQSTINQFANGR